MEVWINDLAEQFKLDALLAIDPLQSQTFMIRDAKANASDVSTSGKPLMEYVQAVVRYSRSAGLNNYSAVLFAWKGRDPALQRDVDEPKADTELNEFI